MGYGTVKDGLVLWREEVPYLRWQAWPDLREPQSDRKDIATIRELPICKE